MEKAEHAEKERYAKETDYDQLTGNREHIIKRTEKIEKRSEFNDQAHVQNTSFPKIRTIISPNAKYTGIRVTIN